MKNQFTILHIDPLGQGVHKQDDQIIFIPKTLPGEKGTATIIKKRKGVSFGQLLQLEASSPLRLEPLCPHFNICPGCHYLHTSYQEELKFKIETLERMVKGTHHTPLICLIQSPQRLAYRNRLQLHYNLITGKLGLLSSNGSEIFEIPRCQLPLIPLQKRLEELYSNQSWKMEAENQNKKSGHLEIYQKDQQIKTSWNRPYAEGGFTQVNPLLNQLIPGIIEENTRYAKKILDLFGGNGNLSRNFSAEKSVLVVDSFVDKKELRPHQKAYSTNLYDSKALTLLSKECPKADLLLVNPPRSGFDQLFTFEEFYQPQSLFYMSCNPATFFRDIKKLPSTLKLQRLYLIDFFPSTYHFEILAIFHRS